MPNKGESTPRGKITEITGVDSRDRAEVFAKDTWIGALLEGNVLVPQANLGVVGLLGESLLLDPPDDWEGFFYSDLTDEQIRKIGVAMSNIHHKRKVPIAAPDSLHRFEEVGVKKVLDHAYFQEFWQKLMISIIHLFVDYVNKSKNSTLTVVGNDPFTVNSFFHNDLNKPAIDKLKRIVTQIAATIRGERVKPLSELLQQGYDGGVARTLEWGKQQDSLQTQIINIVEEEVRAAVPDADKGTIEGLIRILNERQSDAEKVRKGFV